MSVLTPLSPSANPVWMFIDPQGVQPLRTEAFGEEHLEQFARDLAQACRVERKPRVRQPLLRRFRDNSRFLEKAHHELSEAVRRKEPLSADAEWLLDNYYIIANVVREVKRDLPASYYAELPVLAVGPARGFPRVFALAFGLIAHTDSSLDENEISRFVRVYQNVQPLSIGELWAVPAMLRLGLLENLRRLADQLLRTRTNREQTCEWARKLLAELPATSGAIVAPPWLCDSSVVHLVQTLRDQGTAGPILEWLEDYLHQQGVTVGDVLRREHQRQAANQVSIGNAITSLRLLDALDWSHFFEQASHVEALLHEDPAGAYPKQDFATRDRYRRAVEQLAKGARIDEEEVARRVVEVADTESDRRRRHVGFWLIDEGRRRLEKHLGYRARWNDWLLAKALRHPSEVYFGSLAIVLALFVGVPAAVLGGGHFGLTLLLIAILLLPVSELAVHLVHFLVTRWMPPTVLPKLDFRRGIPSDCATFVVIPGMLTRAGSAAHLLERLEVHYLANVDPNLSFALLTDFADAAYQETPEEQGLVRLALNGIRRLNKRYGADGKERFFLFHRRRQWNPSESCWMGWERKRGKLQEFNRLLRGDGDTSFTVCSAPLERLPAVRYVLTLDADTTLPREVAQRLIGTLAHPLNCAEFDPRSRLVVRGYGLLQPRVSFLFHSRQRSRFARLFAGAAGVDPYSAAVSDVYQDLFGAGSYTGKGLYDIDAFETATGPAFPENHILSHDLIESNFARCGLATDIEVLDDFPAQYHAFARREHRWVRGDWQLLPWLGWTVPSRAPSGELLPIKNPLTALGRWKIIDNLRRSLVPIGLVIMLVLGWTILPGPAWMWTLVALGVLAVPLLLHLVGGTLDLLAGASPHAVLRSLREEAVESGGRALLLLTLLADRARLMADAIGVTLFRLCISRQHLLEWETAAATEERLSGGLRQSFVHMQPTLWMTAIIAGLVLWINPASWPASVPVLLLWLISPVVAFLVSQPTASKAAVLDSEDVRLLRRVARKTWAFFETFLGPTDNWLPPDNYQEAPVEKVAHRTSPTNMGLLLLSTLAAHDFGYVDVATLLTRLDETFATLDKLERFHGHFLNWYDTRTLKPLYPPYVSTVDSGNMLGCLLTLEQGLIELSGRPFPRAAALDGLNDVLDLIVEELAAGETTASNGPVQEAVDRFQEELLRPLETGLAAWDERLTRLEAQANVIRAAFDKPGRWVTALIGQLEAGRKELSALAPWVQLVRDGRLDGDLDGDAVVRWERIRRSLDEPILPTAWTERRAKLAAELAQLRELLGEEDQARITELADSVRASTADHVGGRLRELANRANHCGAAMDFRFLYNDDRNLFAIGFNLPLARLDNAHYDLLASEASLTSFLAIARGDVPRKHWFHLGRPVTRVAGLDGLLSWGGTMFEYLMPRLVLPHYPKTLIDAMQIAAVARQIEYGRQKRAPWGVSESAFNLLDAAKDYQYQSFGVPGLGLKRGLGHDLVVAPYATALATAVEPVLACRNFELLRSLGAEGAYGFYESLDFTPERVPKGQRYVVIPSYMAHHQGMALVALANCVLGDIMPHRLHAAPMVRATELLLQERAHHGIAPAHMADDEIAPHEEGTGADLALSRRITTPNTPSPRVHLLSNGEYTVMVTPAGSGFSTCRDLDVTHWREDPTLEGGGQFFYIRDITRGKLWSAAFQPVRTTADAFEAVFSTDKAEFRRVDGDIETHLDVVVSPEKKVEVRRLTLSNRGHQIVDLEVTSFAEIVLCPRAADLAHPVFQKLFLETESIPNRAALLCRRRPRAANQKPVWAIQVLATDQAGTNPPEFETDRARFIGRRRTFADPAALDKGAKLSGTVGPVLDPVFSFRHRVHLEPGTAAVLAFSTGVADKHEDALALVDEFHSLHAVTRTFELAWAHARVEMRHLNLQPEDLHVYQRLAGYIVYPSPTLRAPGALIARNTLNQTAHWRLGISGDLPIVVVRINNPEELPLAQQLLRAHTYWRSRCLKVDLVLLNEHPANYLEQLHEQIQTLVRGSDAHTLLDKPGGIFPRKSSHLMEEDRTVLLAAARVILAGDAGTLAHQVDALERRKPLPPQMPVTRPRRALPAEALAAPPLRFANETGGFSPDGEYVIAPAKVPPAPWINVVANPSFGFLVSDSGAGYTWAGNSQQNRLTPWSNDPVSDPPGEVIYLRDEDTGETWSPTPLPVPGAAPTLVRHGAGYTSFEQRRSNLEQRLRLFTAPDDPVKFLCLSVVNRGSTPRRLSATFYAEWVLGVTRDQTAMHIVTEVDPESGAVLARNPLSIDFGTALAFADVLQRPRTLTGDRNEFLGRNGSLDAPAALRRTELSGTVGAALDPCVALQTRFDLPPGGQKMIVFVLGQAATRDAVRKLVERYRYRGPGQTARGKTPTDYPAVEAAFRESQARWTRLLSAVQVKTPNPALDLMLNRWLLVQVLACRFWGRSAFYQSGGAYGFRDQLQDIMALVHAAPGEARAHILRAAARQFEEGDVQHWWHPPAGRGVRTRFSDDFLWLPFVVHYYAETTGDMAILDEKVPFIKAPLLAESEEEVYGQPAVSDQSASVYEHCARALEHGWKLGAHGLPLMGIGDWNDGMNRVGNEGKGESVWVGWFQATCLRSFAGIAEQRQDHDRAKVYHERAAQLRSTIEEQAWDGRWYRRAYFDDGTPLGSASNDECRIDSLTQTWAVISGIGDPDRARQAMDAVLDQLVLPREKLILLFTPPFNDGPLQPGYIKGYLPGIRENGGQYTHAATWVVQALAMLKRGDKAVELFDLLNPIHHADTPEQVQQYRVEPYVIAADVYSQPPHTGRGGWTWYTGSASWYYRVGLESILGFHRKGTRLELAPCIPAAWDGFEITYRHGSATYEIRVRNPQKISHGRASIRVDGGKAQEGAFDLLDDGRKHVVEVELLPPVEAP